MPRRLVTISYTGLNAGGGVPKFNRDLHSAFSDRECLHFCWDDFPWSASPDAVRISEWNRAKMLNEYLIKSGEITVDDVIVADGFWADGLWAFPFAVTHSHGIWSHLTHTDVMAGKQPDMPFHHMAQVQFRKNWTKALKHITAVSNFIAEQMKLQWGFLVDRVINNGVDTEVYRPAQKGICSRRLVIHGVNDRSNLNKGFDHIERLSAGLRGFVDVMSLDEATAMYGLSSNKTKPRVLARADVVVHPSGFEGNSMFVAEALACGVPIVGYDVGYLCEFSGRKDFGCVIPLSKRSPDETLSAVSGILLSSDLEIESMGKVARSIAPSLGDFINSWRSYIEEIENA